MEDVAIGFLDSITSFGTLTGKGEIVFVQSILLQFISLVQQTV